MAHESNSDLAARFAYIWHYVIDPAYRSEFLAAYDSDGAWVQLFSRDPNYRGTVLLRDADDENRFITIDYWSSRTARDTFRKEHAADFESLDKQCEVYTVTEVFVGDFTTADPAGN